MKNKIILIIFFLFLNLSFITNLLAEDQFTFDVTEIEITENGNKVLGKKRGTIKTNNDLTIDADKFRYNKILNVINATGKVIIKDKINNAIIYSENITYFKNQEKIYTEGKSKAIINEIIINADEFEYHKILNILNANGNVKIEDPTKDQIIFTENITYLKNQEKIFTTGKTKSVIEKKYNFYSNDTLYLKNEQILSSDDKSYLTDENSTLYKFDQFRYQINKSLLKGKNVSIVSENFLQNGFSDDVKFEDGFFNLKNKNFNAGFTKINLKKETYGNLKNDPRLLGVSSKKEGNILTINKGIFTSCGKNKNCPAWSIKADKIRHDRKKRQLIYDNAILKVYNMPVMYLPKFFHPDPSVDRQSGFLQPILNSSEILSDSIYIPYFKVISDNKDATLQTTIFEDKKILFQSEYRQKNKNSNLLADIGYVNDYKSSKSNNSNSLSHIFAKYESNLDLNKFNRSSLDIFLEKTSSDTYLGVFNNNLINTPILPSNYSKLTSGMYLALENENYQFDAGFEIYENLKGVSSGDRFQYTLPFYSYSKNPIILNNSTISLSSSGSNSLTETNKLTSIISNSISYNSFDIISKLGFKNNFNAYFNNKNIVSKNNSSYKSSLQSNIINIMEANTSLPLIKIDENYTKTIIPKISFRFNPSSMKDDSAKDRGIDVSNIFNIDRMNLGNSFEAGKSLTFGVDFRKENLLDINNYFSLKLGTVIRDTEEDKIPKSTTLNRKNSNLFGSIEKGLGENINLEYNFSLDNDYRTLEYNGITSNFNFDNFDSTFTYSEENGERGDASVWSNETSFNIDEKHYFTFGTRRNRKLSLTEYYDLVYDYRNDCLKAGFKYKKTYYDDRDIKPKEDLLLTITFSPLTTYEHKVNQDFYRN